MKTKIVTIVDIVPNYGNYLQNYAVQEVVRPYTGECPETILYHDLPKVGMQQNLRYIVNKATGYHFTDSPDYWKYTFHRISAFLRFRKAYIPSVPMKDLVDDSQTAFFFLGSDQVWNPSWYDENGIKQNLFLLTFIPPQKRVCMSPSFGLPELPEKWKPWFTEHLKDFPILSVREDAGADIIRNLTGQEAEVLIDPTLMLSVEQWRAISRAPRKVDVKNGYILVYVLGDISEEIERDINRIAEEKSLKVHLLMQRKDPYLYASGPAEFLYLVDHAELIITDSFHACVFSFLFERPFLAYHRKGAQTHLITRIKTLLEKFGLNNRLVKPGEVKSLSEILEVDYSFGKKRLFSERKKVEQFLLRSIGGK